MLYPPLIPSDPCLVARPSIVHVSPSSSQSVRSRDRRARGFMVVSTAKSHSSTCGWSPAYRELVANQFPYIPAISINWPLISAKGDATARLVLLLPLVYAPLRAVLARVHTLRACSRGTHPLRFISDPWHSIHPYTQRQRLLRLSRINPG